MKMMSKQTRNGKLQKSHKKLGKRGFGLVELVVAMALVAILSVAVYSFYEMMHLSADKNIAAYDSLEECSDLKLAFCRWAAEQDIPGAVFTVGADGSLTVRNDSEEKQVQFSHGVLRLGGDSNVTGFEQVKRISFSTNPATESTGAGSLIKCVVEDEKGEVSHFVFALRCASAEVAENE